LVPEVILPLLVLLGLSPFVVLPFTRSTQTKPTNPQREQQLNGGFQQQTAAQAASGGTVHGPIARSVFTEDTDLTLPSGQNEHAIDNFLAGTALAGLGGTYMQAERTFGVSAIFLVALSIHESNWGRSNIARDKHNLFGWRAYDIDPRGNAMPFTSFAECILVVAKSVRENYLTPGGRWYLGPTLKGMAPSYASDRAWASKVVKIARGIPLANP
jgi:beta-N-acetylglucosaminidase